MQIAFVSSLTPEDEARFAGSFMNAIAGILDVLPIAYSIHITTATGVELDRTHMPPEESDDHVVLIPPDDSPSLGPHDS